MNDFSSEMVAKREWNENFKVLSIKYIVKIIYCLFYYKQKKENLMNVIESS
jgi:hypothetical protein